MCLVWAPLEVRQRLHKRLGAMLPPEDGLELPFNPGFFLLGSIGPGL